MPPKRKAHLALVLLECVEFLAEELRHGLPALHPAAEGRFARLRDRCHEALGEPTVADAHRIRQRARKEK